MRVLSVASECAPLIKTGGLADVVGALPAALADDGVEMRVMLPGYPSVMDQAHDARVIWTGELLGIPADIRAATAEGLSLLIVDAPRFFDRAGGPYLGTDGQDWPDNPERFAALSMAAARIGMGEGDGWRPDLVHCHDWQAGLVPTYLSQAGADVPTIMTIHNIAFNGSAGVERLGALGLESGRYHPGALEFYGRISTLKAGLVDATKITTVSPTYAAELTTPEFGMGLDGVIRARRGDLIGILNGIDTEVWDPAGDAHAPRYKTGRGKAKATKALRTEMGLAASDGPLAVVISRLTEQKGLDLLLDAMGGFLDAGGQVALLGSGSPDLEARWRAAANHPGVAVTIGYDEALSHRLMAGGDVILVPSRFEPCGLTQLYGLRYGTIPVVARTGGLADTVIDANDAALASGVATGLQHMPGSVHAIASALDKVVTLFADRGSWDKIMRNAMRHPVGWDASAARYAALYRSLIPAQ